MRASTTLTLIASLATLIAAAPVPTPPPGVKADTAAAFQACLAYFPSADSSAPLNKRDPASLEDCYQLLADDNPGHVEAAAFRRSADVEVETDAPGNAKMAEF
ncbi:hypothetical protein MMC10_010083 [Thelotrema lepadinum]|nr:hypothetical protein [Thelotrema lepadinum]